MRWRKDIFGNICCESAEGNRELQHNQCCACSVVFAGSFVHRRWLRTRRVQAGICDACCALLQSDRMNAMALRSQCGRLLYEGHRMLHFAFIVHRIQKGIWLPSADLDWLWRTLRNPPGLWKSCIGNYHKLLVGGFSICSCNSQMIQIWYIYLFAKGISATRLSKYRVFSARNTRHGHSLHLQGRRKEAAECPASALPAPVRTPTGTVLLEALRFKKAMFHEENNMLPSSKCKFCCFQVGLNRETIATIF